MPSPIAADMQDEGNDFPNVPVAHSKRGFGREGSAKAEHEMADSQGFDGRNNLTRSSEEDDTQGE